MNSFSSLLHRLKYIDFFFSFFKWSAEGKPESAPWAAAAARWLNTNMVIWDLEEKYLIPLRKFWPRKTAEATHKKSLKDDCAAIFFSVEFAHSFCAGSLHVISLLSQSKEMQAAVIHNSQRPTSVGGEQATLTRVCQMQDKCSLQKNRTSMSRESSSASFIVLCSLL